MKKVGCRSWKNVGERRTEGTCEKDRVEKLYKLKRENI